MNVKSWRTAVRFGVPFGMGAGFVGSLNDIVQAYRRAIDPSAHGLVVFSYFWLLMTIICILLAGQMSARASGSLRIGVWAGVLAGVLCLTIVFFIFIFSPTYRLQLASPGARDIPPAVNALIVVVILLLFSVIGGGLLGAFVALPGAWLGRRQARIEWLNAPSLPEQPLANYESTALLREPFDALDDALDDGTFMAMIEGEEASSDDIIINPSWRKSLLFCLMGLALAVGCYAMARSGQHVVIGWGGAGLFGLTSLLPLINLIFNRPLLCFSVHGIAFKGAYTHWRRGEALWHDVGAIALAKAPRMLFGRDEVHLDIQGGRRGRVRLQNWQLPSSTRETLVEVLLRFHQQIDENDIVVQGIE